MQGVCFLAGEHHKKQGVLKALHYNSSTPFKHATTDTREKYILPVQILEGFTKEVTYELSLEKWIGDSQEKSRGEGVERAFQMERTAQTNA